MATKLKLELPKASAVESAYSSREGSNTKLKLALPNESQNRGGLAGGLEYLGASAAAGVGGIFEGTFDLVAGTLAMLGGNKVYAENLFANNVVGEWHKNIADGYNPNKAMKFVGDVTSGLGQSATMLIPYAGVPLFFAGAIGGGVGSAVEKTGELGFKEYAYGATTGMVEGLLERYLSSAGQVLDKVTKGATKNIVTKISSQIAKDWAASAVWKGVAKDMLSNAAGEFFEEAISEAIDPVLQRGFRIDEDASTSMKEIIYAGLVGFGSGLLMGGVSTAISTGTAYKVGKRSIDNGNADAVVRDAHKIIDAFKIDKGSKGVAPYLTGLKSSLESYELATNKKSDAATIYLGQVQGYMSAVESAWAVQTEASKLAGVSESAAKSFAEYMSFADKVGDVSKNYTAADWFADKKGIRTRYAAYKWAGVFLGDTVEMAESVAFDEAIRADREGRAVGTPVVQDIEGATFPGESGTYNVAPGEGQTSPEGDYLRVMKLGEDSYSIAQGNSSEQVRGYRALTKEQAQAEFERIKGAVIARRANTAQNQNLEAQAATDNNVSGTARVTDGMYANIPTGQVSENPYTVQQMNAARRAVKNFDMQSADVKGRVLRWMQSVEGKGIDADVVSGIANIIRLRPDLQVMLGETREGVAGIRAAGVAGRNLIVLSEKNDVSLLRETIAHELGHELEGEAGYKEIKEAALTATKQTDIDEWRELYKKYDDVDAEIAAKALGRRLATPRFVERFANRSIIRRAIDFGKMLLDALRADNAGRLEIAETEKLIDMMNRALQNANVQVRGENAGKKYNITSEDLSILRSFGRKSINELADNPEFIRVAEKWARKFYSTDKLKTKSPFFRAWFGDWRAYDQTQIPFVEVNTEKITPQDISKAGAINEDTGWKISVSNKGIEKTANANGKWSDAYHSLKNINALLENAVLLDTTVIGDPSKKLGQDATFMHHFYCPISIGDTKGVAKLYVAENRNDAKIFYLTKIEMASDDSRGDSVSASRPFSSTDATISVSEIFDFVKAHDKDFEKDSENFVYFNPKPVSREVLNADGTPKVFYHGTRANFTTFELQDNPKFGRALGDGFYFTSNYDKAFQFANGRFSKGQDRGGIIMPVYLRMQNPYVIQADADRTKWINEYRKGDYDAIVDLKNDTYYVEGQTQIKSATDNIGTFDRSNPDIRYNLTPEAAEQAAREAAEVEQFRNEQDDQVSREAYEEARRQQAADNFSVSLQLQEQRQELYKKKKRLDRKERAADIAQIVAQAKDNNDIYYEYDDVFAAFSKLNNAKQLDLRAKYDLAFELFELFNQLRRPYAIGDSLVHDEYEASSILGFALKIANESPIVPTLQEGIREVREEAISSGIWEIYESIGKQTPRARGREQVKKAQQQVKDTNAQFKRYKDARKIERDAEIRRIETMARDYNEIFWQYADVRDTVRAISKMAADGYADIDETAFRLYRAYNHISKRLSDSELADQLNVLFELMSSLYEQQNAKSFRDKGRAYIKITEELRKLYEEKAKQTPRDKQRQRVNYAEGQAKLKTLLDRIDRRRATLKKSKGSLANKEWQNLVEAAHRIRPRFELSYDGIKDFIDTFIAFADRHAPVAVSAAKASLDAKTDADAERAAQELKKFAEERTAGQNQLLDFIDPKLMEAMLTLQEAMTPGKDAEGNDIEVKKLITPAMLDAASSGIQRMLAMDSRVDKIFRNGRWEHVETVSGEMLNKYSYAYRGRTTKNENRKVLRELIRNGIVAAIDPETAVHLVEGVFGDTTLSEGIHIIKMAYEIARNDRDKWLKQFDDFQKDKAHKAWRKAWNEGEMTLKWASYTIDGKPVTQEITITKQEAAQLYMTSKRTQARAALALGRLEFSETTGKGGRKLAVRKVGVSNETVDQMLSMEEGELNSLMLKMEQAANMAVNDLYRQFSAEDKQYIKLMEKFYNGTSKNVKKICDTEYYGYTNVIDGYYVPISRGDTTYDIDLIASRMRSANDVSVSGYSFNYATVKGARSRLVIGSAQSVLERHAQQLSLYKNMTHPLQNMQRLYNYRQSSATDNVYSVREFIHDYAWDGMDAYLSNYFKDVQGMRTAYDTTSQMFRKAKGGYAKAVLGLNLASGIKQMSSFLQLPGVASIKAVMRGLSPELIRSSRKEIDKYSKLAENRHSNVEMYHAAGASGKIGAVGDVLMKHLELGDRAATVLFWSVAQVQAEIDGKGAVGTESNKEYAGKLVDKWILLIQDTSAPTTKSALARHPQELVSAMTMFQSSAMKIFSRAVNSIHELYLLGQMAKRTDLSSEEKARVKEAQEKAGKAAAVLGGTILAAATFESIVGLIRDKIRGNDDEEESDAKRIAVDTMLNVMGTVPVLGGFAESAFSGYDITEFYTDFLNDGITATRNMANVTAKVAAGEAVESEDILKALKGVTVFSGQLMGIPVNNAMNIVKSTLNMTSPKAAYRYEAMFYEPTYTADLAKAVKSGKSELAEVIYRMAQKDIKTGGAAADAVVNEMVRLYGEGHNVLPRSAPTSYEDAEGNTVKLKAAQVRRFSEIYGVADGVAAMVATAPVYAGLTDELKAKALRVSYEIYHSRAKSEVLGSELSVMGALSYLEDYIDVATLVAESAYIYGIKATTEATRAQQVKQYVSGYSPEAQAILLYAAGYRSEQVKQLLGEAVASLDEETQQKVKNVLKI